ncbi:DUF2778 domain-containing protein [Leclercia adecarboxylata]|uniref:tlde1 domain-containing protein n=1 Tax=Leclercia adecarboxylata TaxID=83655 RepID=UPI002DBA8F54|nr:tlde1 domain-containing protein [Leclercia adecarboxylata]MEB6377722.1 DUF2778 domain-containing protein [Leclercia adecarboxylata]
MIQCTFHLNGNQLSNLSCPGIGFFPAYSGTGTSRNNADDITFIGHVERGHFRLHPTGYKGVSEGCITLPRLSDFMLLRDALLKTPTIQVTSSLTAFGTIQVY